MLIMNETITIYNMWYDFTNNKETYHRTVVNGASWHSALQVSTGTTGQSSSDIFKVRIDLSAVTGKKYIDCKAYRNLEDVTGYWTLQNNDIIVRGAQTADVTKQSELFELFSEITTISAWADDTKRLLPHWRIGGK